MVKKPRLRNKKKRENLDKKSILVAVVILFVILLVLLNIEKFVGRVTESVSGNLSGDVNLDGNVSIVDAMFIAQYVNGLRQFNDSQLAVADVNQDRKITMEDAQTIAGYRVGKIKELPTTPPTAPYVPSRIKAVADNYTPAIILTWVDNADNEDGFKIYRVLGGTNAWAQIATVQANTLTYTDKETAENTGYSYRVESYNSIGDSIQGSTAYAKTGSAVLSTPTNFQATASLGDANFDGSVNGADSVVITEYVEGVRNLTQKQLAVSNVNADGNVTREDSYAILAYSIGIIKKLPTTPPTAPYVPSKFKAVADKASPSIKLTWQDNSDNEQGFKIGRVFAGTNKWTEVVDLPANTITYTDTGLEPNTTHTYTIKSYNQQGESIQGGSSQATTPIVASTPTNLQATASQTKIETPTEFKIAGTGPYSVWTTIYYLDFSWKDNSNNEEGYEIEKMESGTWIGVKDLPINSQNTIGGEKYNITVYDKDRYHVFRIRAYNNSIVGKYSESEELEFFFYKGGKILVYNKTLTQATGPPTKPTNFKIAEQKISENGKRADITFSWTDIDNEKGYYIEKLTDSGWYTTQNLPENTQKSEKEEIVNDHYTYHIRAFNVNGTTRVSSEPEELEFFFYDGKITEKKLQEIKPPTEFKIAEKSRDNFGTRINLSWKDNSDNEEGYSVERLGGPSYDTWEQQQALPTNAQKTKREIPLNDNLEYQFRIRAYNYSIPGIYSEPERLALFIDKEGEITIYNLTQKIEPPETPTNLQITEKKSIGGSWMNVKLSWTDVNNEEGYRIEKIVKPEWGWERAQEFPQNTQKTVNGIDIYTGYGNGYPYLRIKSFNYYNGTLTYSEPSKEIDLSGGVLAPQPPTYPTMYYCKAYGFTQEMYATAFVINWYDNSNDEDGFKVEISMAGGSWTEVATLPAGSTTYSGSTRETLGVGQSISIRVKSYNKNGESISNKCTSTRK